MSDIIIVYITAPSIENAQEIVQTLIEKYCIACATLLPCSSMYRWNNTIQHDNEIIIVAKTTEDKFDELKNAVANMHPYTIPCILKIAVTTNSSYAQWVYNEVNSIKQEN